MKKEIIETVVNYKNVTSNLLEKLNELQDNVLPKIINRQVTCGNVRYTPNFMSSNIGSWGSALVYVENNEFYGKPLPDTISKIGRSTYMHGDLHKGFTFADRKEILAIAKGLPQLLAKWKRYCESKSDEMSAELEMVSKMLDAIK